MLRRIPSVYINLFRSKVPSSPKSESSASTESIPPTYETQLEPMEPHIEGAPRRDPEAVHKHLKINSVHCAAHQCQFWSDRIASGMLRSRRACAITRRASSQGLRFNVHALFIHLVLPLKSLKCSYVLTPLSGAVCTVCKHPCW